MRNRSQSISVPIDCAEVIKALRDKAERGDVPAARELREWLDKHAPKNRDADLLSLFSREQRAIIRGWLADSASHLRPEE